MIEITPEQHQLMESDIDQAIEFLNKEIPDWKSKINWDIFHFDLTKFCIAGQLGIPLTSSPGFYMPRSIGETLAESVDSPKLSEAYDYMGEIWKQKAKPV